MSFQGDIPSISLGDVIQNLTVNQKTGSLSIRSGKTECRIRFRNGKIVSYNDGEDLSILDWLVEKEIVPVENRQEIQRRYRRAKRKTLGEILNDMQILDLDTYQSYLKELFEEKLYDVLSLRQGTFSFRASNLEDEPEDREIEALALELNPMSVLMEAARRSDDWQKIRKHIPSESEVYVPAHQDLDQLMEDVEDDLAQEALALMDGSRSLRQVISKLRCCRFDACKAVAWLVSEKKARPLDGNIILQSTTDDGDPKQTISRLTAILEREPNNREILVKLADLHEKTGSRDEAAVFTKMLAISYLDDEDLRAAEQCFRRSLCLNPKDHSTWQRLWDTVRQGGDSDSFLLFGKQFVAHFRRLGLTEVARERLVELIDQFHDRVELEVELADIRFDLGDKDRAVKELTEIGNRLLRKDPYEAERIFSRILRYDHDNERARKLCEEISSGRLAASRARRRALVHRLVFVGLLVTLCAQLSYELYVHGKFFQVTKSVFAESLLERGMHDEAIRRVEDVVESYPFSLTSLYKAPTLLRAIRQGQASLQEGGSAFPSDAQRPRPEKTAPTRTSLKALESLP